jgi:hypothetical protein
LISTHHIFKGPTHKISSQLQCTETKGAGAHNAFGLKGLITPAGNYAARSCAADFKQTIFDITDQAVQFSKAISWLMINGTAAVMWNHLNIYIYIYTTAAILPTPHWQIFEIHNLHGHNHHKLQPHYSASEGTDHY